MSTGNQKIEFIKEGSSNHVDNSLMTMSNLITLLVTLTVVSVSAVQGVGKTDYCSKKICGDKKHIGCHNDGKFGHKCPKHAGVVPCTDDLKKFIVEKHNKARRDLCEGNFKGLERAKRMIEMAWDDELAQIAELTARTCVYAHADCRNTEIYRNVGQNIAMYSTRASGPIDYKVVLKGMFDGWFRQAENCNMELIEQKRSDTGASDFAQLIQASCGHVGCAIVQFTSPSGMKNVFFVCNYSSKKEANKPIYEVGPPCSACMAGCSFTSPGLCNTKEELYLLKLNLNVLDLLKLKLRL